MRQVSRHPPSTDAERSVLVGTARDGPGASDDAPPWNPGSALLESQGLAMLRERDRYASLECGPGGGHGHPDRLHLTLHADGVTGSPIPEPARRPRDLFWYRSTLAHNAPRLDGLDQPAVDAWCSAFDVQEGWSWTRGGSGSLPVRWWLDPPTFWTSGVVRHDRAVAGVAVAPHRRR